MIVTPTLKKVKREKAPNTLDEIGSVNPKVNN